MIAEDIKLVKQYKQHLETALKTTEIKDFKITQFINGKFKIEIGKEIATATIESNGFMLSRGEQQKLIKHSFAVPKSNKKEEPIDHDTYIRPDTTCQLFFKEKVEKAPAINKKAPVKVIETVEDLMANDEEIVENKLEELRNMAQANVDPKLLKIGMKLKVIEESHTKDHIIDIKDEDDLETITVNIENELYHYEIFDETKKEIKKIFKNDKFTEGQEVHIIKDGLPFKTTFTADINTQAYATEIDAIAVYFNKTRGYKANTILEFETEDETLKAKILEFKFPKPIFRVSGSTEQYEKIHLLEQMGVTLRVKTEKDLISTIRKENLVTVKKTKKEKQPMTLETLSPEMISIKDGVDKEKMKDNVVLCDTKKNNEVTFIQFKAPFSGMNSGIRKMQIDRIKKGLAEGVLILNEDYIFGLV